MLSTTSTSAVLALFRHEARLMLQILGAVLRYHIATARAIRGLVGNALQQPRVADIPQKNRGNLLLFDLGNDLGNVIGRRFGFWPTPDVAR